MCSEMEDEITRGWLNESPVEMLSNRNESTVNNKKKLFVGFFRKNLHENQLKDYFSRFGNIEKLHMIRDGFGVSRGYAFITFSDEFSVDRILLDKPHLISGVTLETRRAFPKDFPGASGSVNCSKIKIFIGGLPKNITKRDLGEYFEQMYSSSPLFKMEDIIIPTDNMGRSKGFAFITFSNEDMVDKILCDSQKAEICGRVCEIKRAELREEELNNLVVTNSQMNSKIHSQDENANGNLHLLSSGAGSSSTRLVSSGVEKMRKMGVGQLNNNINQMDQHIDRNKVGVEYESITSINNKRTISQRIGESNQNFVSGKLNQETLARIGTIFIDLVSNALESDGTLKPNNSMSSLLMNTLYQIILNAKK